MTKSELLVIAEELGCDVSRSSTKSQIVAAILEAQTIEALPEQDGTLTYTGAEQSPTWTGYDTDQLTLGGTTAGTNAGTYSATFTPIENEFSGHQWWDETQTAKTASWTIGKADGSLTLSADTATLDSETTTAAITVTDPTGEVSAASDDEAVATVAYSEGTVTITRVGAGTATVTVTAAASDNYNAATADIAVTAE